MSIHKSALSLPLVVVTCLMATVIGFAQAGSFAGRYEGTAKTPDGDFGLKLELIDDAGKISGQVDSPHGVFRIVSAQVTHSALSFEAVCEDLKGSASLRWKGDVLAGEFTVNGRTGSVELKKVTVDEISGEWDAVADASGQAFPFTLTLKIEGDKITGGSSSQLGNSSITSGSWKDGKLTVVLEGGQGQIGLVATMVDGKLSGDYDYAGQLQGKWVAIRKK